MFCGAMTLPDPFQEPVYDWTSPVSVRRRRWVLPSLAADPPAQPTFADLIALRRGFQDLEAFLQPRISWNMRLDIIGQMRNLVPAAAAFAHAVRQGKKFGVFGDYDVDGATSTALALRWLSLAGRPDSVFYIPDRIKEGYGPNVPAVRKLIEEEKIGFLLVLDSGTSAFEPLEVARSADIPVVILDHHTWQGRDPYGLLVNPKHPDDRSGLSHLCTVGIVFVFLAMVNKLMREADPAFVEPDLMDLTGIVALGTVADVVPLTGLNRALVHRGLSGLHRIPGIAALIEAGQIDTVDAKAIGFRIAPCINAAGRIDDTRLGTLLLTLDDKEDVRELAQKLTELNHQRRDRQRAMVDSAAKQIAEGTFKDDPVIVIYDESFHPGIVGLVASRVKDMTDKPAVVIGEAGKGSCRAPDGYHIGDAVIAALAASIIIHGGGHAAAAGLTVDPARIDDLRSFLAKKLVPIECMDFRVDAVTKVGDIRATDVWSIAELEPLGQGNPEPVVVIEDAIVASVAWVKDQHLKFRLEGKSGGSIDGILFSARETPIGPHLAQAVGRQVMMAGQVKVDSWNGADRVQIVPDDLVLIDA